MHLTSILVLQPYVIHDPQVRCLRGWGSLFSEFIFPLHSQFPSALVGMPATLYPVPRKLILIFPFGVNFFLQLCAVPTTLFVLPAILVL